VEFEIKESLRAFVDLTRLHFFFVWPTLFCAGLFLAFQYYDSFSLTLMAEAIFIGFLGFEGGLVLNDIVDANIDKKELASDNKLTNYWRKFGKRPIAQGLVTPQKAIILFVLFAVLASALIFTLPFPRLLYVFSIMLICYCLEVFYQLKKRREKIPVAQVIGRIDFALFLVAGYLCIGSPDWTVLALFFFFYPLALAHLGVNDLVDVANDRAKGLNTIPTLYGMKATAYWTLLFSMVHFVAVGVLLFMLGTFWVAVGFAISLFLISIGNYVIVNGKSAEAGIKALPMFHVAMLVYAITIIVFYSFTFL
jgi:4-hydroxybenzoate polyprenyltransferase